MNAAFLSDSFVEFLKAIWSLLPMMKVVPKKLIIFPLC